MERLDIKEGWIHEGWFCHEGELLIHLRDRQDGRQLLGDRVRVLQESGKTERRSVWWYWLSK